MTSAILGFFIGFVFGVGCALAVLYSIFWGGYNTAARESAMAAPPERWVKARAKADKQAG